MDHSFIALLSTSIYFSGIMAIFKYKQIQHAYYPFFYFLWLSGLNELLSFILIKNGFHSVINNNCYVLVSALLILLLFKKLRIFDHYKFIFPALVATFLSVWFFETFIYASIDQISSYFRIFSSFIIVLLSITAINDLLISNTRHLLKNASFLFCMAFIIQFTLKVIIEAFWVYGLTFSPLFLSNLYAVMIIVSLFTNLLYILVVLWIPKKQASLLLR